MSIVSNVILYLNYPDEDKIDEVNKYFEGASGFVDVNSSGLPRGWYGGSKMLEVSLFLGAFNYTHFNEEEFIEFLERINWESGCQVIIKGQEDEWFRSCIIRTR